MARRKRRVTSRKTITRKVATATRTRRRKSGLKLEVKASVAREIWGVIYLSLGIFTFLSLSNNFGIVGEFWLGFLKPLLGWGVTGIPYVFIAVALMFFFPSNKKKISFPLSKMIGLFFLIVSVLSILHLYVPMEDIYLFASEGKYGGYVGFVTNFLFREVLNIGSFGAAMLFIMFFVIGFLLTFEVSLGAVIKFFKPEIKIVSAPVKVKEKKVKEKVDEPSYDVDDIDDEDFSDLALDSGEVVTIKRPQFNSVKEDDGGAVKVIEIKEEDDDGEVVEKKALQSGEEEWPWDPPSLDLLHPAVPDIASDDGLLQENAKKIHSKLKQFGIEVDMHEVHVGPTVIQYTLRPSEGIKLSKITSLKNDLALALAARAVRIEAPIPGKSLVGIEVPNDHRSIVHLRELLESPEFKEKSKDSNLVLPLGRDVAGRPIIADLAEMPHLLIAGATGSGKSVGMNSFLISLLYQNSPNDLKLLMIDPKRVELDAYNGIAHLLTPVIVDPEKAAIALRWVVAEMNRRYQLLSEKKFRNIKEFNAAALEMAKNKGNDGDENNDVLQKMPNIVVVIDELADLMMAASKEVEASICRVAQMARAVGIHLIIATQRPSVDVITGLIKANIPTRIAFAVSSSVDSRTIVDGVGAEDLLGKGDMLYLAGGVSKPTRVQGVWVSSEEILKVTNHIKVNAPANYIDDVVSNKVAGQKLNGVPDSKFNDGDDALYEQALQLVLENRKASASLLQRRLKIGYARAARLLDLMEENGVIGPVNGAKAREIYID